MDQEKTNIKITLATHRKLKTLAGWRGLELFEYAEELLEPIIKAELARMVSDIGKDDKKAK